MSETGRTKVKLELGEKKLLEKLAKQDGVTIDVEFEAAVLSFLQEHDPKHYEQAKKGATPAALEINRKWAERKATKDIADTKKFLKYLKIKDGDWWTETTTHFYAVLKGGMVHVPEEVIEKLGLDEGRFVSVRIDTA